MLPAISIGDPALVAGGDAMLFYGGLIAGVIASVFTWWYANRRRSKTRSPAPG